MSYELKDFILEKFQEFLSSPYNKAIVEFEDIMEKSVQSNNDILVEDYKVYTHIENLAMCRDALKDILNALDLCEKTDKVMDTICGVQKYYISVGEKHDGILKFTSNSKNKRKGPE